MSRLRANRCRRKFRSVHFCILGETRAANQALPRVSSARACARATRIPSHDGTARHDGLRAPGWHATTPRARAVSSNHAVAAEVFDLGGGVARAGGNFGGVLTE